MSESPLAIVKAMYDGSRAMRAALLDMVSEDVEFHAPGEPSLLPWAGSYHGPAGLRRQGEIIAGHMKYEQYGPHAFYESEDGAEILVRTATRVRSLATGRVFESSFVRVFTFDGGKIVRVQTWYDTLAYALALGAVSGGGT